jgi:hypothetical protein
MQQDDYWAHLKQCVPREVPSSPSVVAYREVIERAKGVSRGLDFFLSGDFLRGLVRPVGVRPVDDKPGDDSE